MKIERVSYQKTFSIGPYLTEKIGIEIQLDDTDQPHDILTEAKRIVEGWHIEKNPGLNEQKGVQIKNVESLENADQIEVELEDCRKLVMGCETQEEAFKVLKNKGFWFNAELKSLALNKN